MNAIHYNNHPYAPTPERERPKHRRWTKHVVGATGVALCFAAATEVGGVVVDYRNDIEDQNPTERVAVEAKLREHLGWQNPYVRCKDMPEPLAGQVNQFRIPYTDKQVSSWIIQLDTPICDRLMNLPSKEVAVNEGLSKRELEALSIVVHENIHVRGNLNEVEVACEADQELPVILMGQGHSVERVHSLAKFAKENYANLYPEYKSSECKVGGALDLSQQNSARSNIWLNQG